jgi:hypothetical protein
MSALLMNRASTKEAILAAEGKRPGVSPAESESSAVKGSSPSDPRSGPEYKFWQLFALRQAPYKAQSVKHQAQKQKEQQNKEPISSEP